MIDIDSSWTLVKQAGEKAHKTNMIYCSLVEGKQYRILEVTNSKITIQRITGGENDKLTKAKVEKAIETINLNGGRMRRHTLISPTVAKETAMVLFHPNLSWDETGKFIIEI